MPVHSQHVRRRRREERGASLVEVMIALVVLAIGVLALARLFPAGSRSQVGSRMMSNASYFAQQKAEELMGLSNADPGLSAGRHPAGTAMDTLGSYGQFQRFYTVTVLPSPLASVRRIAISVNWNFLGARAVNDTIYLRR